MDMELLLVLGAFIIGFTLVTLSIPPILKVARAKKLFEPSDERKIHNGSIPSFGGVAIFIGFTISSIVATDGYTFDSLKYIVASVILMFFIGLKDDLMIISAKKKLIVQLFATVLLITLGNIRYTGFHGMIGIEEIHYLTSVLFTVFVMVVIINSFNLIDGIDGLASGLAMMAATVLGVWFYIAGHIQFSIMSFSLVGSLAGFFLYNVFGRKNKLFMGDTGSLVVGLVISTLIVKFNEFNIVKSVPYAIGAAPAVSFAIIIVPLIDTLRVMTIRISNGKSPFSPDKNHIHHRLLDLVSNHFKVTLIIVFSNVFLIGLALLFNHISFDINIQFVLIFLAGTLLSFIPSLLARKAAKKREKKVYSSIGLEPKLNMDLK
jgi:UDP-N-acetylmuramyl pentapeptide phosphotransferase/UDP-N-acetylglucosamine-1-phosphate transferase